MNPYVGQLLLVGFAWAPNGWVLCQGQLLPINENDVLYNLIGTTYGGDGQTNFGLPDLRGQIPIGIGQLPGGETAPGRRPNQAVHRSAQTDVRVQQQHEVRRGNLESLVDRGGEAPIFRIGDHLCALPARPSDTEVG